MNSEHHTQSELTPFERAQIHLQCSDMWRKTEESEEHQSELRIKYFLALITAIIGLLGIILKDGFVRTMPESSQIKEDLLQKNFWIILISLIILFGFGLYTFARIIWSVRNKEFHSELRSRSGKLLAEIDPTISEYNVIIKNDKDTQNKIKSIFRKLKGTFAQFMYLSEGLLAAGIMYIILYKAWGVSDGCMLLLNYVLSMTFSIVIILLLITLSKHIKYIEYDK